MHNGRMFPSHRSRPLIWLALFAWLAQLSLPIAHAQFAGSRNCGETANGTLRAKFAALPAELRDILDPAAGRLDSHASCVQLCASLPAAGGGSQAALPVLASRFEAPPQGVVSDPHRLYPLSLPARGPPAYS